METDDREGPVPFETLKRRLASRERRKVLVFKFGGTTSGSDAVQARLRDARHLIERKSAEGYFVIPVFSALKRGATDGGARVAITDLLLDYRNIIAGASSMREGVREFRRRLLEPHLALMRDLALIPAETTSEEARKAGFKAPNTLLEGVYREVNSIVGDAATFCKFIPGPGAIDNFVSGGERLAVMIVAAYLNDRWAARGLSLRAEAATAREIGILTDGNFGDAHILDESIRLVYGLIGRYRKRGVIPVVTGFDGIYKVDENGKTFRYRTTLGRSGSDLTATFIGYAMTAEATYLVKDTDGVLTANPRHVPTARTIDYLSYDFAVEAGNIQNKAVAPASQGGMDLIVVNPKSPAAITRIGPDREDLGLCLITDPKKCRFVSVDWGDAPAGLLDLADDLRRFGVGVLEFAHLGTRAQFVQDGARPNALFEENLVQRREWRVQSTAAWHLKVVGRVTRATVLRFNAFIEPFRPLSGARWHEGAKALTACFPQEEGVDIGAILRAIHGEFLSPAQETSGHDVRP